MGLLSRSVTAEVAALSRALGACDPRLPEPCEDELARLVVGRVSRAVLSRPLLRIEARRALERYAPGLYAWHVLRTSYFDALLRDAIGRGARQVVVLGAGLDTRAARICGDEAPTPAMVFEVDRSPQAERKAEKLAESTQCEHIHRIVRTDLAHVDESLADTLRAHGFDAGAPAFVLCEGLLMYLSPDEMDALLGEVRSLSPEVTFAFDFVHRDAIAESKGSAEASRVLRSAALVGERYRSGLDPNELEAFLEARGFVLREQLDGDRLAQRVWDDRRGPYSVSSCSSVVHATVRRPTERA